MPDCRAIRVNNRWIYRNDADYELEKGKDREGEVINRGYCPLCYKKEEKKVKQIKDREEFNNQFEKSQ